MKKLRNFVGLVAILAGTSVGIAAASFAGAEHLCFSIMGRWAEGLLEQRRRALGGNLVLPN